MVCFFPASNDSLASRIAADLEYAAAVCWLPADLNVENHEASNLEVGVPLNHPILIIFHRIFHEINHPAIGYPMA